ncbi:MAG: SurA N-terminal domain-containing protein [Treponema sp.]|jgi:hypothetical protein|nr:SurA N-terminal domain-containing protein [Treponema sp.]
MASREKKQPEGQKDSLRAEFVRRFKTSPFIFIGTIIILLIVIVAFVFVPAIVPEAQGAGNLVFGYYNGAPIAYVPGNYFYLVQQELARNQQSAINDSNFSIVLFQIWQRAFSEAVIRQGILDEMKNAGYRAPEEVVDRQVALLPNFQVDGKFSAARYRQLDKTSQMSLWRQVRDEIAARHYIDDLSGIITSVQETEFIKAMASPRRSFDFASIPVSSYPDSEIVSFVNASPSLFRVVHLSRITVASGEREARQILDSIKNETTTFEDAAKESKDNYAESGGDMGIKLAYEMNSEIPDEAARDAVIALPKGSLSDIIKVPDGWAFFRVEDDPRPADTDDLALMEKIRAYVGTFERGRMDDWLLAEADKVIGEIQSKGFDSALYDRGIEKRSFGPLPINYGDIYLYPSVFSFSIPELSSAGSNDNFWQTAFSGPLLTPAKPLILGDSVVILYPTEETEVDESETTIMESFYSYLVNETVQGNLQKYFFSSEKFENRFNEVFYPQVLGYN